MNFRSFTKCYNIIGRNINTHKNVDVLSSDNSCALLIYFR